MRIISGALRGRTLTPPAGMQARPTTDFAKESLFNMLENTYDLSTVHVLDLFAGTGSISFEFASRGCPYIDTIDIHPLHHKFIKDTAKQLQFTQLHALRLNAFDFPNICTTQYDIIFADPPYDLAGVDTFPQRVLEKNLLNTGGVLILEHGRQLDFSSHPRCTKHRHYGNVHFSFFE